MVSYVFVFPKELDSAAHSEWAVCASIFDPLTHEGTVVDEPC
jgi:hypothetical protein